MGNRRFNQVFQHREMREEIKVLEHVAYVDALLKDLFSFSS
jgi:hypothetical protein